MTSALTTREREEIERANASNKQPIVFVHGLWLLAGSWTPWQEFFESRDYSTIAPGWPNETETVAEGRAKPATFAGNGVKNIADHYASAIGKLKMKPMVIGHSFGGLIAQKLAGTGLSIGTVAIDPAPMRGVLPLPFSALRAAFPALRNPTNRKKSVMLTEKQFRFAFANMVDAAEAKTLYERYAVPGAGRPLFQAATANFDRGSEASANTTNAARGPLLIIDGEKDNTVPWAIASAVYKLQKRNVATTEIHKMPKRGHSLTIDSGWKDVAEVAAEFLERQRTISLTDQQDARI